MPRERHGEDEREEISPAELPAGEREGDHKQAEQEGGRAIRGMRAACDPGDFHFQKNGGAERDGRDRDGPAAPVPEQGFARVEVREFADAAAPVGEIGAVKVLLISKPARKLMVYHEGIPSAVAY